MDVKEKIINALIHELQAEYARLEDENGVTGFAVSRRFQGMSGLDRQAAIDEVLGKPPFTPAERRRIVMIAGLTPAEFESVGSPVRIQKINKAAGRTLEVVLHGTPGDAQYVRGALQSEKGVETTESKPVPGSTGDLMAFRVKGTETPITKEKAIRVLKNDPYIDVLAKA